MFVCMYVRKASSTLTAEGIKNDPGKPARVQEYSAKTKLTDRIKFLVDAKWFLDINFKLTANRNNNTNYANIGIV